MTYNVFGGVLNLTQQPNSNFPHILEVLYKQPLL